MGIECQTLPDSLQWVYDIDDQRRATVVTGRSFKDRYGSLGGATEHQPVVLAPVVDWPLPVGARLVETADGPCVVHDRLFSGPGVSSAWAAMSDCAAAFGDHYPMPSDLVFLDTETTGLSGGTGTHVFLVGVGRFIGEVFHVRQFFMRHPGDERAVLSALQDDLSDAAAIVSYNGRTFDIPLLHTRFMMHGRRFSAPERHFDLLSSSRAIWKHRLPSCSLSAIELEVLGVERSVDAPGWMIPQLYFDYLRSRHVQMLEPVFEHNRQDILSLARLAAVVHGFESGLTIPDHAVDRLAVAILRLRRSGSAQAIEDVRQLWPVLTVPSELRLRGLRDISVALKRQRRHAEAAEDWTRALADPSRAIRLFATEELAKHYEHRERDHLRALEMARRGADAAILIADELSSAAFNRRVQRLELKLQLVHLESALSEEHA